jgi:hypothetical protein
VTPELVERLEELFDDQYYKRYDDKKLFSRTTPWHWHNFLGSIGIGTVELRHEGDREWEEKHDPNENFLAWDPACQWGDWDHYEYSTNGATGAERVTMLVVPKDVALKILALGLS